MAQNAHLEMSRNRSRYYFQTENWTQQTKIPSLQQNEDRKNRSVSMQHCTDDRCPPAPRLPYPYMSKTRDLARDDPTQGEALWRPCGTTKDSGFREGGRRGRLTKGTRRRRRRSLCQDLAPQSLTIKPHLFACPCLQTNKIIQGKIYRPSTIQQTHTHTIAQSQVSTLWLRHNSPEFVMTCFSAYRLTDRKHAKLLLSRCSRSPKCRYYVELSLRFWNSSKASNFSVGFCGIFLPICMVSVCSRPSLTNSLFLSESRDL